MQVYGVGFCYGSRFFRKVDFAKNGNLEKIFFCANNFFLSFGHIFTFPNACAIQTNLGTKELLRKTVLENMGYWQNGSEIFLKNGILPYGNAGLNKVNRLS